MNKLEVKKIREELGLTQQELANTLDSNIRTIQKWESGESEIRKSTAYMLNELRTKGTLDNSNKKILSEEEVKEIVYKVATNEERFMQEKIFSNIIELRVAKKIGVILSSEEEYKKWRNS